MELNELDKHLQNKILPDLEKGRPGFDKPHTLSVAKKVIEIANSVPDLHLDEFVLLIAAYAHDWGYSNLYAGGKPVNLNRNSPEKIAHMGIGAGKVKDLLKDSFFDFLNDSQKQRIVHLVLVHDNLEHLSDPDELILMEADTLGGLDINYVKPTLDPVVNEKYMNGVRKIRLPKFITDYGKKEFERLFEGRAQYYKTN